MEAGYALTYVLWFSYNSDVQSIIWSLTDYVSSRRHWMYISIAYCCHGHDTPPEADRDVVELVRMPELNVEYESGEH